MSTVHNGVTVKRPCIRRMVARECSISGGRPLNDN